MFTTNGLAIANVCLYLCLQLRITFVKSKHFQISFYAETLPVNVKIFRTKLEGFCKYFCESMETGAHARINKSYFTQRTSSLTSLEWILTL